MAGRRPKLDRPVHKRIHIPSSVHDEVEIILSDPLSGRPRWGAFSALVTQLLREWLDKRRKSNEKLDTRNDRSEGDLPIQDTRGSGKP